MATSIQERKSVSTRQRVKLPKPSRPVGAHAHTNGVSQMGGERPRLQIDFTPAAFEHLNTMRERAGVKSAAEVAKNALRLYDWYLERKGEGFQLLIAKGDVVKHVELLL